MKADDPLELLDEKEVAHILSMSVAELRKWRYSNQGPPWLKLGRSVRYRRCRLVEWIEFQENVSRELAGQVSLSSVFPGHQGQCKPDR